MKSGFGGGHSYIVVFIFLMLFAIRFGAVMATGIDTVNLLSPGNATWTNQNNDTIAFELNYTGDNATAMCKLYVSNSTYYFFAVNQNASVYNATNTTLYSNLTIQEGTIKWYVNCTNDTTLSSTHFTLRVDRTKPIAVIHQPANSTTNSDAFNFTYNENTLNCSWYSVDGGQNTTSCLIIEEEWTGTLSGLSDGQHNITVWANDTAGNENSTTRYWIRDTIAPPIYVISPGNISYSNAIVALNVSSDGTEHGWKSRLNGASNWSFTPNVTIEANEGSNNVTVWVNDTAGNENSTTVYFTIDLTNPMPVIFSPMKTTYSDNPQLNFSYFEARPDACWYSLNGTANVTLASCNTNGTVLVSSQGANNVTLCMNDTSGRVGCYFVNYTKDINPPSITIHEPANTSYKMQNINFNVSLNKIGDTCLVDYGSGNKTMNAVGSNLWWNHTNTTLPEGVHQAVFYCNDTAGTGNTTSIVFTVDLTPPSIIIQSPLNQTYNTSAIWFNVTASADVDMCLVEHTKVGTGPWTNRTMTNSSGSWNRQNTTMVEGQHRVKYYCNDTAGNWNSTSYLYLTVDTIPPVITVNNPMNSTVNSDAFSFAYDSVNCSWYLVGDGANATNCSISGNQWAGTLSSLSDGQHNISVWANDSAGNVNSTTRYWLRDTIPSPVTILLPQNITYNTTSIPLNVSSDGSEHAWKYSLNSGNNQTFSPNTTITAQYGSNVLVVYVNDSANNINASQVTFFVNYTAPRLESPVHFTNDDDGWGETHYFRVNCSDSDGGNATIFLWFRRTPSDAWSLLDQQNCTSQTLSSYLFIINSLTCSDVTPAGQNSSYKFNATDASSLTNQTDPQNFTITKDDVSFQPASGYNNSAMWRNNSANYDLFIRVRLYDTDKGQYLTGGNATVWVTKNASNPNSWDIGKALSVNSSGYITYQFSNDSEMPMHECNYTVGLHNWTAGIGDIYEDSCYETTNSSTYNLSIWSDLRPHIASPVATEGFLQSELINISGYVDDDCTGRTGQKVEGISVGSPAPRYVLVGESGTPTRYCTGNWTEGGGWYNCSWDSTGQLRVRWNVTMSVDKSYYSSNSTTEGYVFHVGTAPSLSSPTVSSLSEGWGYRYTFTVYFADADSENDNISLWKSFDNFAWNYVDSQERSSSGTTLSFYERFDCSDIGEVYYKFNTTDPYNFTDETSPESFNITADNVTLTINSSVSSLNVSFLNYTATLAFVMRDDDMSYMNPNGSYYPTNAKGIVWITENGANYTRVINCTTTSGGHCQVSYNPNASSSTTGLQYWKGGTNDSCYEYLNSTSQALNVTSPIASTGIHPRVIVNGSEVNLFISASSFQAIWANVTLPNSNVAKTTLTNNANKSFSSTSLVGRYNVTFYANDSLGEIVNATDLYFDAFLPVAFNMSVINQSSEGMNSSVIFYCGNDTITYNSSVNGSYHSILADTRFDIEIHTYSDRLQLRLNGINLSSENNESLGIDKHTSTSGYLVTYGINTTYNTSGAALRIYYDDLSYSDEPNLRLYKCANYSFSSRNCLGSWEDVTGNAIQNTTEHYFIINVSSFSGFGLFQYTAPSPPSGSPGVTGWNCVINWSCSGWEPCRPTGTQIRICRDTGPCKTGNRTETRNCSYAVPSSCYDNILNQDETDIDCGGHCSPCGSGKACRANPDCQGALCENGLCRASAAPGEKSTAKTQETGEQTAPHWIFDTGMLVMVVALAIILALAIFSCIKLLLPTKKEAEGNEQAKT